MPKDGGIGASTVRREDIRFLTGKGRYTADINLRGQGYACFLRSEVAHGRINKIDTAEAMANTGNQFLTTVPAALVVAVTDRR